MSTPPAWFPSPDEAATHGTRWTVSPLVILALVACEAWWLHQAPTRSAAGYLVPLIWLHTLGLLFLPATPTVPRIMVLGVLARIVFVGTPPLLSDDLYRYLWEGAVLNAGMDPFSQPPLSIDGLDDALRDRVNHPEMGSIYPPLALGWFRILAFLGTGAWLAQLGAATVDMATVALLARLDKRAGLLWALHPLAILESAQGAHLDVLAVCCCVAAVSMSRAGRSSVSVAWLGAGIAIKLLPITMVPASWWRSDRLRSAVGLLVVAALGLFAAAPALFAGQHASNSLEAYAGHWSFNGALFTPLAPWLGTWTRPVLGAMGVLAVLAAWRHHELGRMWLEVAAAFVFLTPTAHPWYGLWLLAPALLCRDAGGIVFASALPTAYLVLLTFDPTTGAWEEGRWLWSATWLPPVVVLLARRWIHRYESQAPSPNPP